MPFNDNQAWAYPPKEPFFPQNPAYHFIPYIGRPIGDESYRHTTVLSTMGRGPKGAKGDTFTYDDLTDIQVADLASHIMSSSATLKEYSTTLGDGQYNNMQIPIPEFDGESDILYVYLNGLKLVQGSDYYIVGDTIVFNTRLDIEGTSSLSSPNEISFSALSLITNPVDQQAEELTS